MNAQRTLLAGASSLVDIRVVEADLVENCTMVSVIATGIDDIPGIFVTMLGVYIVDGLAPSSQLVMKMQPQSKSPTHGNDRIAEVMKKENRMTGRTISGKR